MPNLRKWSTTATGNASVAGGVTTINWSEGQAPSTVNNSQRETMAQIRKVYVPSEWSWVEFSGTVSIASQTTFKITGDQTTDYSANRRVRLSGGSTTRFCTIVSASFTAETTVTITVDSGSLSASMTVVAVSSIVSDNVPKNLSLTAASETVSGIVELATTGEAETGTDTTRAITAAGLKAAVVGRQTIWVPAGAMIKNTASAGPATGQLVSGSSVIGYLAYDSTSSEDAEFSIAMPKNWDEGSVALQFYWMHPATATNFGVTWSAFVKAYSNDDNIDGASFTSIGNTSDTGGTTSDLYISPETASTAVGSAAENDLLNFIARRTPSDGSDTMAVDAYLIGVFVFYNTNNFTDD